MAPTFLDIAGVDPPAHMDGRSAFKLFHKHKKGNKKFVSHWPDTFLIESSGRREHNKNKKNSTTPSISLNSGKSQSNLEIMCMFINVDFQKILVLKTVWELLLLARLINYLYYVSDQIIKVLVNLDKNGTVCAMDTGLFFNQNSKYIFE